LSGPVSIQADNRAAFFIEVTDLYGNPVLLTGGSRVTVYLSSSNPATGVFYDSAAEGNSISSIEIVEGSSGECFYYGDNTAGLCILTGSDNSPAEKDTGLRDASFIIEIISNTAPVLAAIGNRSVDEETELTFTVTATDIDVPEQDLTFSLDGAPAGAAIDPATGVFSWTPGEVQGPNSYDITFNVSDGLLIDSETITITVNEVNSAPVLNDIPESITIPEMSPYTLTVTASDFDLPADNLSFSVSGTFPAYLIDDGYVLVLTLIPDESQGPGDYDLTIRVTDGVLTDTRTIAVTRDRVSIAPELSAVGDKSIDRRPN
jgi:hypothetical protein